MTLSLTLACIWAVAANLIAMFPSRDFHWRAAYALIAIGVPLLGYVTLQNGPMAGLFVMVAGVSMLRWPIVHLGRWAQRMVGRRGSQ
ncbi:DUF2484 family protein [Pseudogemmobacter sp. W21_MBD1_M6]|uniref:DUF2484 family protein n=1 Tax=Pseudogemmobacter sp. W21_MBD1_M6 TaxID=3240271 RepID=UPI003F967DF1